MSLWFAGVFSQGVNISSSVGIVYQVLFIILDTKTRKSFTCIILQYVASGGTVFSINGIHISFWVCFLMIEVSEVDKVVPIVLKSSTKFKCITIMPFERSLLVCCW